MSSIFDATSKHSWYGCSLRCVDRVRSFGDWAREQRVAQRYSQDDIARLTGYSQVTVSRAELGHAKPTADYVIAFANALGIDVSNALKAAGLIPSLPVGNARQPSPPPPEGIEVIERRLSRMTQAQRDHYLRMFRAMIEAGEQGGEYDSAGDGN